jgi:hypothetical protein
MSDALHGDALHEARDAFARLSYLDHFEHLLARARYTECRTIVLTPEHFHLLAAALCAAAGGVLVGRSRADCEALHLRLQTGEGTAEDQVLATEFLPRWYDGRAMTIGGEEARVTNARYRGTYAGFVLVTLDPDSFTEYLH